MAIGLYGGSFDPIHFGHLITTQSVLEKRKLEQIIFMPSHISPLKQDAKPIADYHRLEMVKLAVETNPQFSISDLEIQKGNVSYTIDTLIEIKKKYVEIELIIGLDNLCVFDKWYKPEEIFELAKVIVMKRDVDSLPNTKNIFFDKAVFVDTPTIEITSTDIRHRVKNDLPIDYLVPCKVKEYISQNRLYK